MRARKAPLQKRARTLIAYSGQSLQEGSCGSLRRCVSPAAYKARPNTLATTFALMALPMACKKPFRETPARSPKSKRRGGMACTAHFVHSHRALVVM